MKGLVAYAVGLFASAYMGLASPTNSVPSTASAPIPAQAQIPTAQQLNRVPCIDQFLNKVIPADEGLEKALSGMKLYDRIEVKNESFNTQVRLYGKQVGGKYEFQVVVASENNKFSTDSQRANIVTFLYGNPEGLSRGTMVFFDEEQKFTYGNLEVDEQTVSLLYFVPQAEKDVYSISIRIGKDEIFMGKDPVIIIEDLPPEKPQKQEAPKQEPPKKKEEPKNRPRAPRHPSKTVIG